MATNKIQTGLRLPVPMYDKLKVLAANDSRTVNNLVELILRRYIEDYERANGPVQTSED